MSKEKIGYQQFLETVEPPCRQAVEDIHALLEGHGCKLTVETARAGYVASYRHPANKRVVLNFVFRKSGLHMRLYADHVHTYTGLVAGLPPDALKKLDKAPDCKRLLDFTACSSQCAMGYDFELEGRRYQKCRYNAFLLPMTPETIPSLTAMATRELEARQS